MIFSLVLQFVLASVAYCAAAPEQIALSYDSDPTAMVVTWAISDNDIASGVCMYGSSPDKLDKMVKVEGSSYTLGDYVSPMLFKASLTGLESGNKEYYYSVGSSETGEYSEVFSFKSHPGIGVNVPVTFHVVGDLGQTENSQNTLQELLENEQALDMASGGIVNLGDLSYANGDEPKWDTYGNMKQFVATSIPSMHTPGNHEWFDDKLNLFTAYKARYPNPGSELYYSYDVGLVHFVMVAGYCTEMFSVETQPCLAEGTPEYDWLVNDLQSVNKTLTPWVFVIFHQPYVNSNTHHSMIKEGRPMQKAIEDVLYNSGVVDLAMSGHVHAYERSCRVYQLECTEGAPYYITIGDGGNHEGLAEPWVEPQPNWSMFRLASYGHGELAVMNETHALWQWHQNQDLSTVVADEFWIVKGSSARPSAPSVTRHPVFADTERGRRGALFEAKVKAAAAAAGGQQD